MAYLRSTSFPNISSFERSGRPKHPSFCLSICSYKHNGPNFSSSHHLDEIMSVACLTIRQEHQLQALFGQVPWVGTLLQPLQKQVTYQLHRDWYRHLTVINSLLKERQRQQGQDIKERDAFPPFWDREQDAEISSDLKEQTAASRSTSGSPVVMGKRCLGQEKQPQKE